MSSDRQRLHNMVKLRDIEIARLKNDNKRLKTNIEFLQRELLILYSEQNLEFDLPTEPPVLERQNAYNSLTTD